MRTLFALTRKELGLALMVVNHTLLATGAPAIPIAISGELSRAFLFSHFAEPTRQRPDPAAEHRWDLTGHLFAATVAINISLALTKAALGPQLAVPVAWLLTAWLRPAWQQISTTNRKAAALALWLAQLLLIPIMPISLQWASNTPGLLAFALWQSTWTKKPGPCWFWLCLAIYLIGHIPATALNSSSHLDTILTLAWLLPLVNQYSVAIAKPHPARRWCDQKSLWIYVLSYSPFWLIR